MAAERIPLDAIGAAPAIGHLIADFPQLREELVAHAFLENFHRASLERFRTKADGAMDELHVLVPELLEEGIELSERFRNDVSTSVVVRGIVDSLDRQTVCVQVVLLIGAPKRLVH